MTYLQGTVHGLKGEVEEERLGVVVLADDPLGSVREQVSGVVTNGRPVHLVIVPEVVAITVSVGQARGKLQERAWV